MTKHEAMMMGTEIALTLCLRQEINGKYQTKMGEKDALALGRLIEKIFKKHNPETKKRCDDARIKPD